MLWCWCESYFDNISINLSTIHVKKRLLSVSSPLELNISVPTRKIDHPIHGQLHIDDFTIILKDLLEMSLVDVPGQAVDMEDERGLVADRRQLPQGRGRRRRRRRRRGFVRRWRAAASLPLLRLPEA